MKLARRAWLIVVCITASSLLLTQLAQANEPYVGQYELLTPPQATNNPDKVEVLEFFWYGCPHCFYLEKNLRPWLKTKPDYVEFKRVPAVFSKTSGWAVTAKAYYTADALDILEKIHTPFFEAIHKKKRRALKKQEQAIQGFFADYGVTEKQFSRTYHSFWVDTQIGKALDMTQNYGISGVPVLFINGKYRLTSEKADGYDNMKKVLNYLIEKEYKLMNVH